MSHDLQPTAPPAAAGPMRLRDVVVVIPAWQPDHHLPHLVQALQQLGFQRLVLVNDGSAPDRRPLFEDLQLRPGVTVLRHARNLGKGSALKTAFQHITTYMRGVAGVVTADADGQHLASDVLRVAEALLGSPSCAVLGVRSFGRGVPLRSRWGNALTRRLFAAVTGCKLADTQTGLRGFAADILPALLELPGERYEYETVVLAWLCQEGLSPEQVPVETVYLHQNRGSHFKPFQDSVRICRALFRAALTRWSRRGSRAGKPEGPHLRPA